VKAVQSYSKAARTISAASYAAAGDYKQAALMTVTIAASAVGAGAITKLAAKAVDRAVLAGKTANVAARAVERGSGALARVQSRMHVVGVNSKLFGHADLGNSPGKFNNYGNGKHIDLLAGRRWTR
jgi:hypothetical protein